VRRLDWLARFRVEDGPHGDPVTVVDRGGRVLTGAAAAARALSRLPLTAWPALPATAVLPMRRPVRGAVTTPTEVS
jgi:predicted DCC family thiol-disulfide oxidoreductase YuxK